MNIIKTYPDQWGNSSHEEQNAFSSYTSTHDAIAEDYLKLNLNRIIKTINTGVMQEIHENSPVSMSSTVDNRSNHNDRIDAATTIGIPVKSMARGGVKKSLEVVSRYKKPPQVSTFYQTLKQYLGTVRSIDSTTKTFTASLISIDEGEEEFLAEFELIDVVYKSDREIMRPGALFIWLIGQEVEHGTIKNITHIIFRRTSVGNKRVLQEAKDNAREWARLLGSVGTEESAIN